MPYIALINDENHGVFTIVSPFDNSVVAFDRIKDFVEYLEKTMVDVGDASIVHVHDYEDFSSTILGPPCKDGMYPGHDLNSTLSLVLCRGNEAYIAWEKGNRLEDV